MANDYMTHGERENLYPGSSRRARRLAGFPLVSDYRPAGINQGHSGDLRGTDTRARDQVLLGVTGSKPLPWPRSSKGPSAPPWCWRQRLAAQLYAEMKGFFPDNAVEYFVSYYDYYQPEAYVPRSDTYIEKDASINERIDRMRHSATRALLERRDVILVASVSCIYGIGAVETYEEMILSLKVGDRVDRRDILRKLVDLQYKRNDQAFFRGAFRVRGDIVEIFPSHMEDRAWRLSLLATKSKRSMKSTRSPATRSRPSNGSPSIPTATM